MNSPLDPNIETIEIAVHDFGEAINGAVMVACQSVTLGTAELAVQANTAEDPVRRSLSLLDRIEVRDRSGAAYVVTLLKCTSGRTIEDEFVGTGVIIRVERRAGSGNDRG